MSRTDLICVMQEQNEEQSSEKTNNLICAFIQPNRTRDYQFYKEDNRGVTKTKTVVEDVYEIYI